MREILFRGKGVHNNQWYEGVYSPYNWDYPCGRKDKPQIIVISSNECVDGMGVSVIPDTVGQCTGLTDKNSVKIFEGDIVTGYFDHEKIVGYIFYGSDAKFFIQRDGLYGIELNNASDWLEVIGNIYDNPELLKEGEAR